MNFFCSINFLILALLTRNAILRCDFGAISANDFAMKFLGSLIIGVFCAATVGFFGKLARRGWGRMLILRSRLARGLPLKWSASLDENVAWRTTLPETGQSTPVVWGDRVFLTTMKPVEADATVGNDTVAYCLSATDGKNSVGAADRGVDT